MAAARTRLHVSPAFLGAARVVECRVIKIPRVGVSASLSEPARCFAGNRPGAARQHGRHCGHPPTRGKEPPQALWVTSNGRVPLENMAAVREHGRHCGHPLCEGRNRRRPYG